MTLLRMLALVVVGTMCAAILAIWDVFRRLR